MADFWGPALDAELAYRHERLFTALRGIPATTSATARARASAPPTPPPRPASPHGSLSAARGWLLRGSETWHAAR